MVKKRNQGSRKSRNRKGFCEKRPKPKKISASTAYETCSEQLNAFGVLLALINFFDLVGFREIFHFAYRPLPRSQAGTLSDDGGHSDATVYRL